MQKIKPTFFTFPILFIVLVFILVPTVIAFYISVSRSQAVFDFTFLGFRNYIYLFTEERFLNNIFVTFYISLLSIYPAYLVGLLIALYFRKSTITTRIILGVMIATYLSMPAASAIIWRFLLDYSSGIISAVLYYMGMERVDFFSSQFPALNAIILAILWREIPIATIFLWSGLQNISPELDEAASLDGAGRWEKFRYITLPLLKKASYATFIILAISSGSLVEFPMLMTAGGPFNSTETLVLRLYREGFLFLNWGTASAVGVIALVISTLAFFPLIKELLKI
jgi:ABC-type sugar transport system permease subunit